MKTKLQPSYLQRLSQKNNKKGFTLTELLLVITIAGIVPGIIMPLCFNHYNFRQAQVTLNKLV